MLLVTVQRIDSTSVLHQQLFNRYFHTSVEHRHVYTNYYAVLHCYVLTLPCNSIAQCLGCVRSSCCLMETSLSAFRDNSAWSISTGFVLSMIILYCVSPYVYPISPSLPLSVSYMLLPHVLSSLTPVFNSSLFYRLSFYTLVSLSSI